MLFSGVVVFNYPCQQRRVWWEFSIRPQVTFDFLNSALRCLLIHLSLSLTAACHLPTKTEGVLRRVGAKSKVKFPCVNGCVCVCVCPKVIFLINSLINPLSGAKFKLLKGGRQSVIFKNSSLNFTTQSAII